MKAKQQFTCIMLIGMALAPTFLFAQAPQLINYQGKLVDKNGNTVSGKVTITFNIYSSPIGGTALWTETQGDTVVNGVFNVLLGSVTPFPRTLFAENGARYLGIKVGNDTEMTPRLRLTSVSFALRAAQSDSVRMITRLNLPFSGSVASDSNAFSVENTGNGTAGYFAIENSNNINPSLLVGSNGSGNAGVFAIENPDNTEATLFVTTNGKGNASVLTIDNPNNTETALFVSTNGKGNAATFEISNTNSNNVALRAVNRGRNSAGAFEIENPSNSFAALFAQTNGTGRAGLFLIDNPSNNLPVLHANTNGMGDAGFFEIKNSSSKANALHATTNGLGDAGFFEITNPNNTNAALFVETKGSGPAASFNGKVTIDGDVNITGRLSKGSGSFKIDHPLDPANKYLYHSFVESPDMLNIYNGNVTLEENGEAWIELPEWFEALNHDFRYQLTAIGTPGPNLYVAEEINNNRFKIAGGHPWGKVSWQVTGVRHDAYAKANPIPVEEIKPESERGHYLYPEVWGQPETKGIKWLHNSEKRRQISKHKDSP